MPSGGTSLLGEQGVYRCKEPGGWIPRPDSELGNYVGGEVGHYVGVKSLQLGNYFGADTLVIAASFLHTGRELGLATRLPVVLLAAVSVWLMMDLADNRSPLLDQSWAWLSPRLASPYVAFASLFTLIGAQEASLGVAIVFALAFAALMPGPIVVAMILRVRRDRPSQRA